MPTSNVPPAEGTRRWDGDERGHGVANALSASHAVARLLEAMALPDWVAEQPEVHLLPHIEAGLADLPLRLLSARTQTDGAVVVDLAWTAERPSRGAVRAAAYQLIGSVAELSTHVHETPDEDSVEFVVTTGILGSDGGWRGHGHVLRLRVNFT